MYIASKGERRHICMQLSHLLLNPRAWLVSAFLSPNKQRTKWLAELPKCLFPCPQPLLSSTLGLCRVTFNDCREDKRCHVHLLFSGHYRVRNWALDRMAGKWCQGGWCRAEIPDHWQGAGLASTCSAYQDSGHWAEGFLCFFPDVITFICVLQPTKVNLLAMYGQHRCQCCLAWHDHSIVIHCKVLVILLPDW